MVYSFSLDHDKKKKYKRHYGVDLRHDLGQGDFLARLSVFISLLITVRIMN